MERTYDYLWTRLQRVITESQHEKNLASIQEGLKKGPKKFGLPGGPSPDQPLAKMGGKGKGGSLSGDAQKGKSKGKEKGGRTKPNQKVTPKTRIQENKMKKENQMRNLVTRPHPRKVFAYSSRKGCVGEEPTVHTRSYKHQGSPSSGSTGSATAPKAKATSAATAAPKAQPSKAAMVAMVVLGTWHSGRSF